MADSQTAQSPWSNYFFKTVSEHSGYARTMEDVSNLLRSFEISTVTKFSIWKTEKKNFGHTGE